MTNPIFITRSKITESKRRSISIRERVYVGAPDSSCEAFGFLCNEFEYFIAAVLGR